MRLKTRHVALALAIAASACGAIVPTTVFAKGDATAVDIPYQQFTLPNGLRVIVHEDHKAPIVAVNIWYHVGSLDEPAGRSGFAHLFEHLMFNGSENHKGDYFPPFEQAGATGQNGTTNTDRTNYFENVPTTALDMALWMESDRMGHLLGAIDQGVLDEQRGVVQNEKRQNENQPYGQVWDVLTKTMYPKGHPYHHTVIGSMGDLNAASLNDVKTWFRTWYGPNNAVLVLAGDIDLATAKQKVARYFGDIPATPTMKEPKADPAPLKEGGRTVLHDKVPQVRMMRVWNVAQVGTRDSDMLDLFAQVLGGSASSRLDRRLVYQDKLVDSVSVSNDASQLGGNFLVSAMVKQGVDPKKVEAVIDEELQKLLREGPSADEMSRARTTFEANFIRGVERIGGFGGKADALASCTIYTGNPGCFRTSLANVSGASAADVAKVGNAWLKKPSHVFVVEPGERKALAEDPSVKPAPFVMAKIDPKYKTIASDVDRTTGVPGVDHFPALTFPSLQRGKLANGTTVILAERHEIPVVQMNYLFNGGYSSDLGGKPGTASFAMGMLNEGAAGRDALTFKSEAEALGAHLGSSAGLDGSSVTLSALTAKLDASVGLLADMLRKPTFAPADIDRVKTTRIAGIRQEKARPTTAALRVLPPLLYGEDHPYAMPMTGSGTEASVAAISRDDLEAYRRAWVRPENATLVVVGDTTLDKLLPVLNRHLGDWKGEGAAPKAVNVPQVALPSKPRVFLIDQQGAVQANIIAAELVPSTRDPDAVKLAMANDILGGVFSSRLNMNLREDKHWSYGARSMTVDAQNQRPWLAMAPVQIDKTAESIAEARREISDYASGKKPATQDEVTKVVNNELRGQPGAYETAGAVLGTMTGIVRYGRPDNWVQVRNEEIAKLTPAQVADAVKAINPDALTWVVVGDLKKIEAPVRALNLGEVTVVDANGKPVAGKK